jgi:putative ATP-dependent endonuclease of the OLD family
VTSTQEKNERIAEGRLGGCMPVTAIIRQLRIERFRGIEDLTWNPEPGMNLILGGGDVGKTTILEAIALLLSPSSSLVLAESDYWRRKTEDEFIIRAVIALPNDSEISQQAKFNWPWHWDGANAVPPIMSEGDVDIPDPTDPVYCLQVRGNPDLEISWEVVQPNNEIDPLSPAVRKSIGIVRLGGDDRNDRDLRLVYGSALDRLLSDKGLRARLGQRLADVDLHDDLSGDAKTALDRLDRALKDQSLPHKLELGLTGSQGLSIGALTGLLAEHSEDVMLPLASWGSGTRRMSTLQIASATESHTRITVVDEIERGLEPYRLRKFVGSLQSEDAQSFVTTHSPIAIAAAIGGHLWFLDTDGNVGPLPGRKIRNQQQRDPQTFLARLSVICEGVTEVGFLSVLLERSIANNFRDYGIHVADGNGNHATLALLECLSNAGLNFAGFADSDGTHTGRWDALKANMEARLFQWAIGCLETNVIALVPDESLEVLIKDSDGDLDGDRLRTLADRLRIGENKDIETLRAACVEQATALRDVIIAAATGDSAQAPEGRVKEWKKHGVKWFKTESGGRELAEKAFSLGLWPHLRTDLLPFLNAARGAVGLTTIADVANER